MDKETKFKLGVVFTSLLVYAFVVLGVLAIFFRLFGIGAATSSLVAGTWGAAAAMFVALKLSKKKD